VPDPQNLRLWLEVDGKRYQDGTTKTMVVGVVAQFGELFEPVHELQPGDIIRRATPPGVGARQKPPVYLRPGNVMRLGIDGLASNAKKLLAWS